MRIRIIAAAAAFTLTAGLFTALPAGASPNASQPCPAGWSKLQNGNTGDYLLSPNVAGGKIEASATSWSCWMWPATGNGPGYIHDEAGWYVQLVYKNSGSTNVLEDFAYNGGTPQQWATASETCNGYGPYYVFANVWATDNSAPIYATQNGSTLDDAVNCTGLGTWYPG